MIDIHREGDSIVLHLWTDNGFVQVIHENGGAGQITVNEIDLYKEKEICLYVGNNTNTARSFIKGVLDE